MQSDFTVESARVYILNAQNTMGIKLMHIFAFAYNVVHCFQFSKFVLLKILKLFALISVSQYV